MFNPWELWNRFRKRHAVRRMTLRARLFVEPLEPRLALATRVWDGGALDNFVSSPANWSDDTLPLPEDTVVFDGTSTKDAVFNDGLHAAVDQVWILVGYTGTISGGSGGSLTVNYLFQEAGTLAGSGSLFVNGRFDWLGGTQAGSGLTELLPGSVLAINGADAKYLDGSTLRNYGDAAWMGGGSVYAINGASIQNNGTFDIQTDGYLGDLSGSGTDGTFVNGGTVTKSAGGGTTTLALYFNNNSSNVTVQTGALDFQGGGILAGGTFWTDSPDAVLLLTDGTYEVTQDFTAGGEGLIVLGTEEDPGSCEECGEGGQGKQKRVDINLAPPPLGDGVIWNQEGNFPFRGGVIRGRGMFIQKTGTLTWTQGIMRRVGTPDPGGASTVIENGASMTVEGNGPKQLVEWTIENKAGGFVKLDNTEVRYLRSGSISNQGQFVLRGTSKILRDETQPITFESFVNSGDFFKDGDGAAEIRMPFTNLAHFHLQAGTLNLSGELTQAAGTARIFLDGNTLSAAGTLRILGGKLQGPGTLNTNLALEAGEIELERRGVLSINGNYTQHAGTRLNLRFEGAQHDSVQITGTADAAGTLRVLGGATAPPGLYTVMAFFGGSLYQFDLVEADGFDQVISEPLAISLRKD